VGIILVLGTYFLGYSKEGVAKSNIKVYGEIVKLEGMLGSYALTKDGFVDTLSKFELSLMH